MDVWIDYSLWIVCVLIYTFIIIRYVGFPFIWKTQFSALTIRDQTAHKSYLSLIFKTYVDGYCVKTSVMLCEYSKSPPTTCSIGEILQLKWMKLQISPLPGLIKDYLILYTESFSKPQKLQCNISLTLRGHD